MRLVKALLAATFLPLSALAQDAAPRGIETADLDREADPCSDFYE